jgi:hypothetical protein
LCSWRFATATGGGGPDDSPHARMVDVEEVGLATTNAAVQNTTALTTAVAANPAHVYCFGRGDYHVDNSGTGSAGLFL